MSAAAASVSASAAAQRGSAAVPFQQLARQPALDDLGSLERGHELVVEQWKSCRVLQLAADVFQARGY